MNRGSSSPAPSSMGDGDAALALHGLRVIELGKGVAPAFAGRWLAAFGAGVTAVEPPGGHWLRRYSPTGETLEGEMGPLGAYLYAGASVIALDADREQDRAALRDLLAGADILLHDLTPDRLARWGLKERAPRADLPALIQVALTPFGTDGPYAGYAATSIVSLALGGYQFLTGESGREPLMLPGFQPEYLTALYGMIAALAGVVRRHEEGSGCAVEISAMEALASLHQFTTSQWLYEGGIRTRHGNRWENLYPITMLPCRDGYVTLSMPGPDMWERLCLMIERPELVQDPRFATPARRHENADALDAILVDWLRDREMDELFRTAQEQWRLPVNPYHELDDVLRDPQYSARGFWVRPGGDDDGVLHPGLPVVMSESPWRVGAGPTPPAPLPEGKGEPHLTDAQLYLSRVRSEETRSTTAARGLPLPFREGGRGGRSDPAPHDHQDPTLPLSGLRVLDFTRVWSGPLCTRILADLGAQVIKVEAPFPRNVPARGDGPTGGAERPTAGMGKLSRNKLSVCIDLRLSEGRELVKRLAGACDVLVENFSARVMPNFGLGYDVLREVNPGLIMLSMSGYGATGPYRDYLCYGSATESMTGMTGLLGYPGEEPLNSAIAYPDAVAGLSGAAAVLTALVHRQRTGGGQFLDLSQIEPATAMFGEYFLDLQMTGRRPARSGNQHPYWAPHGTYRCRGDDEWVSLAVRSDEEWRRFLDVTRLPAEDVYATAEGRRTHRGRLDAAIGAWTAGRDKFEVMDLLQRAGIPAGAVLNAKELVENPHLAHRGFFVDAQAPEGGSFPMPGTPITIDGRKRQTWQAAAYRGEHNHVVLKEVLGLSDTEVESLIEAGAIVEAAPAVS